MRIPRLTVLITLLIAVQTFAWSREKQVRVVTTLGVLRSLTEEIGGDRVQVISLANPLQDPHYIQPKPTLMQSARRADLFIEIGLQLELWTQKVVDGAGNPKIQLGRPGRVIASEGIRTLEVPAILSREWGDIHPYGNPHVWLDPVNARRLAWNISQGLERVDPEGTEQYEKNRQSFLDRLDAALYGQELVRTVGGGKLNRASLDGTLFDYLEEQNLMGRLGGWLGRSRPLWGKKIITYHKTWIYFANRFGLRIINEIEEFPGIAPAARHRDRVVEQVNREGISTLVISNFYRRKPAEYISQKTGANVVTIPIDVGAVEGVDDYFQLIDHILSQILGSVSGNGE